MKKEPTKARCKLLSSRTLLSSHSQTLLTTRSDKVQAYTSESVSNCLKLKMSRLNQKIVSAVLRING